MTVWLQTTSRENQAELNGECRDARFEHQQIRQGSVGAYLGRNPVHPAAGDAIAHAFRQDVIQPINLGNRALRNPRVKP
jgi:hypothetical protein